MNAVRTFADDDVERAVPHPEDRRYLLKLDPSIHQHEVVGGRFRGSRREMEFPKTVFRGGEV